MMLLITIASFFVLLCGLFDTIVITNSDLNVLDYNNIRTLVNDVSDDLSSSCVFNDQSVSIILFTSDIPQGQVVEINNKSCDVFDPLKPAIFLAHGFLSNAYTFKTSNLTNLLINKGYTVFSLDWSDQACYNDPAVIKLLEYPSAVDNTRDVGAHLASFIKKGIECGIPLRNITLTGHSLGAHVSGFAAKNLQNSDYGKPPLLIGIEPASPLFQTNDCINRFCKSDAERVIALHTSVLGIQKSIADLDLWYNNGVDQPGCGVLLGGVNVGCSHTIAIDYLANTLLDNCGFVGVPTSPKISLLLNLVPGCSSNKTNCIIVDDKIFNSNYTTIGDYCVSVSSEDPYCTQDKDQKRCTKQNKSSDQDTYYETIWNGFRSK